MLDDADVVGFLVLDQPVQVRARALFDPLPHL